MAWLPAVILCEDQLAYQHCTSVQVYKLYVHVLCCGSKITQIGVLGRPLLCGHKLTSASAISM
jgi:hypothetical protein